MTFKRILGGIAKVTLLLALAGAAYASFIESSMGTAVVNDASASYFNPAALANVKNPQIIPQGTVASFRTRFTGRSTSLPTHTTESGSTSSNTLYYSPTLYAGTPVSDRVILGLAIVTNSANRSIDQNSILRYVQASNEIQDCDVTPALAVKINDKFTLGGGLNFSYANFTLQPINGFAGSNIADNQSRNESDGSGIGANAGFMLRLNPGTVMGFNYRSLTTYQLNGKSIYEGNPRVVSHNYQFKQRTPARSIFSINHFVTSNLGFITTLQYIQWSAIKNIPIYGIANAIGTVPVIVSGNVPYYLHDTWSVTLGTHYKVTPKWTLRFAGTYNQSPGNSHYQITNGDSIILGITTSYEVTKRFTVDGSYAHAFIQNENININTGRYRIQGVNDASRDAVSMRLILNL